MVWDKIAVLLAVGILAGLLSAGAVLADAGAMAEEEAGGQDGAGGPGDLPRHPPPFQQQRDGVFLSAIRCNEPNELYVRGFDAPVCITSSTFERLVGYGIDLAPYDESPASGVVTNIVIGSLAPLTGGAAGYGADIRAGSELALADFNAHLEERGEMWRLETDARDTKTSYTAQLEALMSLDEQGISIVDGPAIDIFGHATIEYANDNDMLLFSCCSAVPLYAIPGDALLRMTPDQTSHGSATASIMRDAGIKVMVTAGRDALWITELLAPAEARFLELGGSVAEAAVRYGVSGEFGTDDTQALADSVRRHLGSHAPEEVAILYVGFEETFDFIEMASLHDVLGKVRWFGADANTIIHDNEAALVFAENVNFTALQPTIIENELSASVLERLSSSLGRAPSVYAFFEYDLVQLIGRSILDAQSTAAADVAESIPRVALEYAGTSGTAKFNDAGDRINGLYAVWEIRDGVWEKVATVTSGLDAAE